MHYDQRGSPVFRNKTEPSFPVTSVHCAVIYFLCMPSTYQADAEFSDVKNLISVERKMFGKCYSFIQRCITCVPFHVIVLLRTLCLSNTSINKLRVQCSDDSVWEIPFAISTDKKLNLCFRENKKLYTGSTPYSAFWSDIFAKDFVILPFIFIEPRDSSSSLHSKPYPIDRYSKPNWFFHLSELAWIMSAIILLFRVIQQRSVPLVVFLFYKNSSRS